MSSAEFYDDLARQNPTDLSLRFGKEYEGRHPSNPVFGEFENYISKATRLQDLVVNWDNTCAEVTLKSLLNGIARNKRCVLHEIKMGDDARPLRTIHQFDFVGLVCALGRRKSKITTIRFGHNDYGESFWLELRNSAGGSFSIDPLVFPDFRALEMTLANLLDQAGGEVENLGLYLCRAQKYMSYAGIARIMEILSTKVGSLTDFGLMLRWQTNEYTEEKEIWQDQKQFPYGMIIQAVANMVANCSGLKKIRVCLANLSPEEEASSKLLAAAIKESKSLTVKERVKLECWSGGDFVPWGSEPYKKWERIEDESDGDY